MIPGCDRCRHGWVQVGAAYAERKAPWPEPLAAELMAEEGMAEAYELLCAQVVAKRAALADSWYPCKDCLPAAFYRWAGGHLEPNHDRDACPECREVDGRRGTRRRTREPRDLVRDGPAPATQRRDYDEPEPDPDAIWRR